MAKKTSDLTVMFDKTFEDKKVELINQRRVAKKMFKTGAWTKPQIATLMGKTEKELFGVL